MMLGVYQVHPSCHVKPLSANFLGADEYGLKPMDNPPLASFDQDANDKEELLVLEDFIPFQTIGIHIRV